MKEFTIEPKADQRPDHRVANAIDDTAETIRGRIDHEKAHDNELTWGLECTSLWMRGAEQ